MKELRIIEIQSFLEGYYTCLSSINNSSEQNWELAINATKEKYNKIPLYRSALVEALSALTD